jgi:hypothetical protein
VPDNEKDLGKVQGQVESLIADVKRLHALEQRTATLEKRQHGILLVGGIVGAVLVSAIKSVITFFTGS